jgi:hypothetical protein
MKFKLQMMKKSICCIAAGLFQLINGLQGQSPNMPVGHGDSAKNSKGTIITAANKNYDKAGGVSRFFLGQHYRKEWAQEVEFEVIDLAQEAGGLTPIREGGGLQTKSLRLRGNNGKEYVLRSVNKDPSRALPPEFVGTFAKEIVQDQISSGNPYAPLAVAHLAKSAGIYHTTPRMVYVPQSDRLGNFNKNFANTLCLFEERPNGPQKQNPAFDFADEVINSERMLRRVFSSQEHYMDERAFLKARLFDTWIGDWDRHEDQWVWAAFRQGGQTKYIPIPRDRDQAFARLDGLIPKSASRRWAVRKTKNFFDPLRDVAGLHINGVTLDREFTTSLTLQDWKEITDSLQRRLTDEKIKDALATWPKEVYKISGEKTMKRLKERREALPDYARKYFYFLNKQLELTGTMERELFEISRFKDSTRIGIYALSVDGQKKNLLFQRTFYRNETKELRLYGLGGDDQYVVNGNTKKGIRVRIIGGEGNDQYREVEGASAKRVRVYDEYTDRASIDPAFKNMRHYDTSVVNYHWKSYKYDWFAPVLRPGYNPDDGFYIGGGLVFRKQQFGKTPFGWMQLIAANYAFETGAYNFWYKGIFNQAVGNWSLLLDARINAPNYVFNYFGQGNDTKIIVDDRDFNRVRSNQWTLSAGLGKNIGKRWYFEGLPFYQSVEVERSLNRFVTHIVAALDSTVFTKKQFGGVQFKFEYNSTNSELYPTRGINIASKLDYTRNLENGNRDFTRGGLSISGYATWKVLTFALRAGTLSNFGNEYEFYQANTLGGSTNLRGHRRDRFSGKTSIYQNTEVRLNFGTVNMYILKGRLGLLAFSDVGRVWIPNETSNTLHWGYGGGVWFLPYNKIAFTVTYGASNEDQLVTLKAGFLF